MKSIRFLYLAVAFCSMISVLTSCHKDRTTQHTFAYADLPVINTGDWWRYRMVDSVANTVDTLKVQVVSATVFSGTRTFQCYIYRGTAIADSGYLTISDTAMTFTSSLLLSYMIKLPFTTGDSWSYHFDGDHMKSLSYITGWQVLGHSYDVFDLTRHEVIPDLGIDMHIQIAKSIGMVSEGFQYSGWFPLQRKSAQLIDYQLN